MARTSVVHPFGTAADDCIVVASREWKFPPGTRPGAYSLSLMADGERDVRIGFAASDTDSIRRTMARDYRTRLQQCYRELLRTRPQASGVVEIAFTAAQDGQATVATLSALDPGMARCLRDEIERWVFAPPRDADGNPTTVTVTATAQLDPPSRPGGQPSGRFVTKASG